MSDRALDLHRTHGERLAAWLLTGPVGHLVGFVAEVAVLWLAWVRGEVRLRLARARANRGSAVRS